MPVTRRQLQRKQSADPGDSEVDDDDDFYDSIEFSEEEMQPERMEDVLRQLFDISAGPAIKEIKPSRSMLQDATTDQLSNLVSQMETLLEDLKDDGDEGSGTYDAPYLDAETYTNYRNNLNEDGSLNPTRGMPADFKAFGSNLKELLDSKPEIPDSYYTTNAAIDDKMPLLEQLFQTKPRGGDELDEDMHNRIMAQEEGFQHQSASFQKYLMQTALESPTGSAGWQDAAYKVKEQRRREEETEQLQKLEKEMEEFATILDNGPLEANSVVCSKCGCMLSPMEIESSSKYPICQVCYGDTIAETSDMRFLDAPSTTDWSRGARRRTVSSRDPMPPPPVSSPDVPIASGLPSQRLRPKTAPPSPVPPPPLSSPNVPIASGLPSQQLSPTAALPSPVIRASRAHATRQRVEIPLVVRSPRTSTYSSVPVAASRSSPNRPTTTPDAVTTQKQHSEDNGIVELTRKVTALSQQVELYRRQAQVAEGRVQAARAEGVRLRKTIVDLEERLKLASPTANAGTGNASQTEYTDDH